MNRAFLFLIIAVLPACAIKPWNIHQAPLDQARQLIERAKTAGAEQCAPKLQAKAVANLAAAAHELDEDDDIHWQRNREPLRQSIIAAKQALMHCANTQTHPAAQHNQVTMVHFAYKSSALTPEAQKILLNIANQHAHNRLVIEGYADERGGIAFNIKLSQQRAQRVASFLRQHGVDSQHIVRIVGFGESYPLASGHNESAWRLNRRAQIRSLSP